MAKNPDICPWERYDREAIAGAIELLKAFSAKPAWDSHLDETTTVLAALMDAFDEASPQRKRWGITAFWRKSSAYELEHTLTNEQSLPSNNGWQISHPIREAAARLIPAGEPPFTINNGHFFLLGTEDPLIRIGTYGRNRVRFELGKMQKYTDGYGSPHTWFNAQNVYFSATPENPRVDGSIVNFQKESLLYAARIVRSNNSNDISVFPMTSSPKKT